MKKKKELPNPKFAIYESGGKYYVKYEGQEEREIHRLEFEQLKEIKEKDFNKLDRDNSI